ncbi:hypothetical protein ACVPOR_06495 [Staphylococcus aureus]
MLLSIGRKPKTHHWLNNTKIKLSTSGTYFNERISNKLKIKHIYAAGDCIGKYGIMD